MFSIKQLSYTIRTFLRWIRQRSLSHLVRNIARATLLGVFVWVVSITLYKPFDIDIFYERMFFLYGLEDPELMSRLGIADRYGLDFFNGKLTDISKKQSTKVDQDFINRNLYMLEAYKRADQTPQQLISTDILRYYLNSQVRQSFIYDQNYLVNHVDGVQVELPRFMIEVHQINDLHDANNYIRRLGQFSDKIDQLIEGLKHREQQGIVAPKFVIDKVLDEIRMFLTPNIRDNILYRDFIYKIEQSRRIRKLATSRQRVTPSGDTLRIIYPELRNEVAVVIADDVYPAYERLYAFLEQQRKVATNIAGAWHLPDGLTYYKIMLQIQTSTDAQPEDLSYTAEDEIPLIQQKIKNCLDELGMDTTRQTGQLLRKLDQRKDLQYADDLAGQKEFFKDLRRQIDSVRLLVPRFFPRTPPRLSFDIKRLPVFRENAAGLITYELDTETSRPEIYINMQDMRNIPRYRVPQLASLILLGMHMPAWYEGQLKSLPTFRRVLNFDSFREGWYAYVNKKLLDYEVFRDRPLVRLSLLRYELLILAQLAADIDMNYNRIDREEVIETLRQTMGYTYIHARSIVDESVVVPGADCVPKAGQLQFSMLRLMLESAAAEGSFDERAFHDFILKNGEMPLTVLFAQVRKRLQEQDEQ